MKVRLFPGIFSVKIEQNSFSIYLFGIRISRKKRIPVSGKILKNVFGSSYNKKMLLSYITPPFMPGGKPYSHTNYMESRTWAEIFDELGYRVDVIDWDNKSDINIAEYDVVCGFGFPYEKAICCPKIKKFFYAPGCNTAYSNPVTIMRVQDFYNKTGVCAPDSGRISPYDNTPQLYFSDMIVTLGNKFVADTYKEFKNVRSLDLFCYKTCDINVSEKNFEKNRNNFLYFGSFGALHKGLDIVLDFFKKHPELNLTVCGLPRREKAFRKYYQDVIENRFPNIKFYNFIDLNSELFKEIMMTHCAFVSPSVSEGGAAAALTVMSNGGLYPIISQASGLDLQDCGIIIENVSDKSFATAIDKYTRIPVDTLREQSVKCQKYISEKHTYPKYRQQLKKYIIQAL